MAQSIGAHVSTAGGLHNAPQNAVDIGAECFQIFGASPRQWKAARPSADAVQEYRKEHEQHGLGPVYLHAAYLVNAASPKAALRKKSVQSLVAHLQIAQDIGAEGLVFHPGSATGAPREEAIAHLIDGMKEVLEAVPGTVKLIVENTAGGGTKLGESPAEIAAIVRGVDSSRVAVCFDTAHAFEAGSVDFSSDQGVQKGFDEWERELGFDKISVVHANDSKTAFASHHDKHENIGEGAIGTKGFSRVVADGRLSHVPWILETPGFDGKGPDKKNIARLESIVK